MITPEQVAKYDEDHKVAIKTLEDTKAHSPALTEQVDSLIDTLKKMRTIFHEFAEVSQTLPTKYVEPPVDLTIKQCCRTACKAELQEQVWRIWNMSMYGEDGYRDYCMSCGLGITEGVMPGTSLRNEVVSIEGVDPKTIHGFGHFKNW